MLQIASGMYFRPGVPLHETMHRTTVYTNGYRLDQSPVDLPIASLRFSSELSPFVAVTVEAMDRLEAERPDGQPETMIATSGSDLIDDVIAVLAFTTNTTWSKDRDLTRRLVAESVTAGPRHAPSRQLRRTFDPHVLLTDDDLADVSSFCATLLSLHRPEFEKAMRAIRRVVDATLVIADDVTLAYTLYVAALESLAVDTVAAPSSWDQIEAVKRKRLEQALVGLSEPQANRVRETYLEVDALGLGRKFRDFTLNHVEPSYFRYEALGSSHPIGRPELAHALNFAYRVRSRQVHALEQLVPEMWALSDRSDTVHAEGRTVLSLEGMNRLCRHVIRRYVERASTQLDRTFNYRAVLPGLVQVRMAPQYWIGQATKMRIEDGPLVLEGFLQLLLSVLRGTDGAELVDMTAVLERVEQLLPGESSPQKRAPLVALYTLWHAYLAAEYHRPDAERLFRRFRRDLTEPSPVGFAVAILRDGDVSWTTAELESLCSARSADLERGKGQPLASRFDVALQLTLARRLWEEGRTDEAAAAVTRAVEIAPGESDLIELEIEANAEPVDVAGLAALDVRALLVQADPTSIASDDPGLAQPEAVTGLPQTDLAEAMRSRVKETLRARAGARLRLVRARLGGG